MKLKFISASIGFAALVFSAGGFSKDYAGSGQWKANNNTKGEYTSTLHCEETDDGYSINSTIVVNDETKNYQFQIHKKDDPWFTVEMDGKTVGGGYCWEELGADGAKEWKVCHYGAKVNDVKVEETIKFMGNALYSIGHTWDAAKKLAVTWYGKMLSSESTPDQSQSQTQTQS